MNNGLKDHQIAALIGKINNEIHEKYDKHHKLPQSTRMTVRLAVEDYLSENNLKLDKKRENDLSTVRTTSVR